MSKEEKYMFNNKELVIKFDDKFKTMKIGNEIFLPSLEDIKYFINKLSDIVYDMEENDEV